MSQIESVCRSGVGERMKSSLIKKNEPRDGESRRGASGGLGLVDSSRRTVCYTVRE